MTFAFETFYFGFDRQIGNRMEVGNELESVSDDFN